MRPAIDSEIHPEKSAGGAAPRGYFIGQVCERVGLSFRTVRHYDEVGLVIPSGRSTGGFRIYTDDDIARLVLIKRMKPLGFSLEEMGELLRIRDELTAGGSTGPERAQQLGQLTALAERAREQCAFLRKQLFYAEDFVRTLEAEIAKHARDDGRR